MDVKNPSIFQSECLSINPIFPTLTKVCIIGVCKDLSTVKHVFKILPPHLYFEIAWLASTKNGVKFKILLGRNYFKADFYSTKILT